jgi:electron transfer flavoprotein alpha subunit
LGYKLDGLIDRLVKYGADNVIIVDDPSLETYMTDPYVTALHAVVEAKKPEILLYGATAIGRDLAPRVSARAHTGLTADCTKLEDNKARLKTPWPVSFGLYFPARTAEPAVIRAATHIRRP